MRFDEEVLDLKHLDDLSDLCVWLGPAYFEDYIARNLEYVNEIYYRVIGCYDCSGRSDDCVYYNSERKLIERFTEIYKDERA